MAIQNRYTVETKTVTEAPWTTEAWESDELYEVLRQQEDRDLGMARMGPNG